MLDRALPGVKVTGASVESVDVGTTTRVRLAVEHDGDESVPRRWFVKLPSASLRARTLTGLVQLPQNEVRFYERLAATVAPACPTALVACTRHLRGFTLVLPDLAATGATLSHAADQLPVDQVAAVIETLAGVHARGISLAHERWLDGPARRFENRCGAALSIPLIRRGLSRAGDAVPQQLHHSLQRYARHRSAVMRELNRGAPATLVHHDCHPGNLYWLDGHAGLLDWQLVRRGDGVGDVAYLLASSLTPHDRAEHERALLGEYAKATGDESGTELQLRYRKHLTYALEAMLVTLAVGGFMPDADATELVRRTAAAVADNDAFTAVDALRQ